MTTPHEHDLPNSPNRSMSAPKVDPEVDAHEHDTLGDLTHTPDVSNDDEKTNTLGDDEVAALRRYWEKPTAASQAPASLIAHAQYCVARLAQTIDAKDRELRESQRQVEELQNELRSLREALSAIAEYEPGVDAWDGWRHFNDVRNIARDALQASEAHDG